jgi:gluconokinase
VKPVLVVMGVSGAGKSTVGEALAQRTGAAFVDSDSLHPQENVQKMAAATHWMTRTDGPGSDL